MKGNYLDKLRALSTQMHEKVRVKHETINVKDIIKVVLTREDGLTLNGPYDTREKYIVIVGKNANGDLLGTLLINHDVAVFIRADEDMFNAQYLLQQKQYPAFLKQDSWLDCTELFVLSAQKIEDRNGEKVAELSQDDFDRVKHTIATTEYIEPPEKAMFGL